MSQLTIQLSDKADALIAQLQKEIFNRRRKKVSAAGVIETLVESGAKSQSDKRFATSWSNLVADIEKAARVAHAHGAKPANLSDEEWAMVLSHRTRAVTAGKAAGRTRPAGAAVKVAGKRSTKPSKATSSAALESSPANAVPGVAVKQAVKAKSAAKPARTSKTAAPAKASPNESATAAAQAPAKTRTSKAKAAATATRRPARRGKATAGGTAAAEGAAIAATAAAATPSRTRRKSASTTSPVARTRSTRASAASRMAKAVSRLGATTNPLPLAESDPMALAISGNGSSPSPAEQV
jgi:hypothetical protein